MEWQIHHVALTESTNRDAAGGAPGDVFWADGQTGGRGRLGHRWLSRPGENLTFTAVLDVSGASPQEAATLPLVAGLSVLEAVRAAVPSPLWAVKWPNDILHAGKKVCGILCERNNDTVAAGIGINVNQRVFPPEIAGRAASLALVAGDGRRFQLEMLLADVLDKLSANTVAWRVGGFAALWPRIAETDCLKGRTVAVLQTDGDTAPLRGVCGGIRRDGALDVGGAPVYAGEAHVVSAEGPAAGE